MPTEAQNLSFPKNLNDLQNMQSFTKQSWLTFIQQLRPNSAIKSTDMVRLYKTKGEIWDNKRINCIAVLYGVKMIDNEFEFFVRLIDGDGKKISEIQLAKDMEYMISNDVFFQIMGQDAVYCLEFRTKKLCTEFGSKFAKILLRRPAVTINTLKIEGNVTLIEDSFLKSIGFKPEALQLVSPPNFKPKETESIKSNNSSQIDGSQNEMTNQKTSNKKFKKVKKVPKAPKSPPTDQKKKIKVKSKSVFNKTGPPVNPPKDPPMGPPSGFADVLKDIRNRDQNLQGSSPAAIITDKQKPEYVNSTAAASKQVSAPSMDPPMGRPSGFADVLKDIRNRDQNLQGSSPAAKNTNKQKPEYVSSTVAASKPVSAPSKDPPMGRPSGFADVLKDIQNRDQNLQSSSPAANNTNKQKPEYVSSTVAASKPVSAPSMDPPMGRPSGFADVLKDIRNRDQNLQSSSPAAKITDKQKPEYVSSTVAASKQVSAPSMDPPMGRPSGFADVLKDIRNRDQNLQGSSPAAKITDKQKPEYVSSTVAASKPVSAPSMHPPMGRPSGFADVLKDIQNRDQSDVSIPPDTTSKDTNTKKTDKSKTKSPSKIKVKKVPKKKSPKSDTDEKHKSETKNISISTSKDSQNISIDDQIIQTNSKNTSGGLESTNIKTPINNDLLAQIQKGKVLSSVPASVPEEQANVNNNDFYSRFKNAIEERNAAGGIITNESDSEPDSDW